MIKLPQGFTDLLPEKAEVFYFVKESLMNLFQSYGFKPVVPPSVELIDTFLLSGEEEIKTFNFIDHFEAKNACFRYDFTPQIGRILSNYNIKLPAKFCYEGSVLRNPIGLTGEKREFYQAGVEIIGIEDTDADIELVLLADKIFKHFAVKDYKLFLGNVNIIKSLFETSVPDELKKAFVEKNTSEIKKIVSTLNLSAIKRNFLIELPFLCGELDLISEVTKKFPIKEMVPHLSKIKKIAEMAKRFNIPLYVDMGEVRGFEYHSGIILDCYALDKQNNYQEVITGGRYDNLLQCYLNKPVPATGFAVDILKLSWSVHHENGKRFLILFSGKEEKKLDVLRLSESLREKGANVLVEFSTAENEEKVIKENKNSFDYIIFYCEAGIKVVNCKDLTENLLKNTNNDFFSNLIFKGVVK